MPERLRGNEIVVLGAGPTGCAIAHALARRKLPPFVLEHGGPGGEVPGPFLAGLWDHTERASTARFALRGAGQFPALQDQVGPIGYLRSGAMVPAHTDTEADAGRALADVQAAAGLPVRWLSREEARQREPALAPDIRGATYSAHGGLVDVALMTRRLAAAARRAGTTFSYHAGHVNITRQGRAIVISAARARFEARRLIVTSGAWLAVLARQLAVAVPTRVVHGLVIATEPYPSLLRHRLASICQQPRGDILVDCEDVRDSGCTTVASAMGDATAKAASLIPAVRDARITRAWPWTAVLPSRRVPLLGAIDDGVIVAVSHTRDVALTPFLAQAAALFVTDERLPEGLEAWVPERASAAPLPPAG